MSEARDQLYTLISRWQEECRPDERDAYPYMALLDEVLFHSDLRFKDYIQFQSEGEFSVRLLKWLENFSQDRQKQVLFKLLRWIIFIDKSQLFSLYRDAYRRVITTWLCKNHFSATDLLDVNYETNVHSLLRKNYLFSITESFGYPDFLHINDLSGLPKPLILGEDKKKVKSLLPEFKPSIDGAIILEDFVGTGKQAGDVIAEVRRFVPSGIRILFIPLIILEKGVANLNKKLLPLNVDVNPVLIIPEVSCINRKPILNEPNEFTQIRTLINQSENLVLEFLPPHDDPPADAFGYKGCGALIVTCNNAPNNTIPLIHHKAPSWNPLFRRVHHSKDHL